MDVDLVLRARQGDVAAFEAIAVAMGDRWHRTAYSILADAHLVEDATQRALVEIWRNLPHLREAERFEGWAYRVLVRACRAEAIRAPRRLRQLPLVAAGDPMAADDLTAVADRDQIERAFRRLSVDQRAVIVLHHLLDLPLDRIAADLGVPQGTVHSRLHRAMDALRASIAADARPPVQRPTPSEAGR